MRWTHVTTVSLALCCLSLRLTARQQVPVYALTRPDAEAPEPFTRLVSVAELPDGRVLASDTRERVVRTIDFAARTTTTVGRNGSGPREYLVPMGIVRMPGDSFWVSDAVNFRWFVVNGSAQAIGTVDYRRQVVVRSGELLGADARGDLYFSQEGRQSAARLAGSSGAAVVLRWERTVDRVDTVVALRRAVGRLRGFQPLSGGLVREIDTRPLAPEDLAAVASSGDVVVLRSPEYQWERWRGGRRVSTGAPIAYTRNPVTIDERRAFARSQVKPGQVLLSTRDGVRPAPTARADVPPPDDSELSKLEWPDVLPPFRGPLRLDDNGHAWVERVSVHTDSTTRFDIIDTRGALAAQVRLLPGHRLVGFGKRSVYVVRQDEDQLQFLQRYDAPSMRTSPDNR